MLPTFFISYEAVLCFFLKPEPMRGIWRKLETYLRGFIATLAERPRAVLAIQAHWEEELPIVSAGPSPPPLFDCSGFPHHTYRLTWRAPGQPALAERVRELLSAAVIPMARKLGATGITVSPCCSR